MFVISMEIVIHHQPSLVRFLCCIRCELHLIEHWQMLFLLDEMGIVTIDRSKHFWKVIYIHITLFSVNIDTNIYLVCFIYSGTKCNYMENEKRNNNTKGTVKFANGKTMHTDLYTSHKIILKNVLSWMNNYKSFFRVTKYSMIQETVTTIKVKHPTLSQGLLLVIVFRFAICWLFLVVLESVFVVVWSFLAVFESVAK